MQCYKVYLMPSKTFSKINYSIYSDFYSISTNGINRKLENPTIK